MPTSIKRVCQAADVNELITVIGLLERHLVAVEDDLDTTLVSLDGANEELVLQYKKLQIERDDYDDAQKERDDYDDAQKELAIANRERDIYNASLVELFNICAKEGFYQGELDGVLAWAGREIALDHHEKLVWFEKRVEWLEKRLAMLETGNTNLSNRITAEVVAKQAKDKQLDKLWVRINELEEQNASLGVECTDLESERKAWKALAQKKEAPDCPDTDVETAVPDDGVEIPF